MKLKLEQAIKYLGEPGLNLYNRIQYNSRINDSFTFVGLSLSRICYANCIFCPITKLSGTHLQTDKKRFMTLEVAEKITDDLSEMKFSSTINLGENGDALLNPNFSKIVKMIREKLPSARLVLYTNAANLDNSLSSFLLENGLSELIVNIDGSTSETYEFSKRGLKFEKVKKNLLDFIRIKNELGSNCKISILILPPKRYMELRGDKKGQKLIPYDVPAIYKFWKQYLSKSDTISEWIYFYNWNNKPSVKPRRKSCPMVEQFFKNLYVSPEGDVYLCCLDPKQSLVIGNILETPIMKIWNSEKRKRTILSIINKELNLRKFGEPCLYCNEKNDFYRCYLNYVKYRVKSVF